MAKDNYEDAAKKLGEALQRRRAGLDADRQWRERRDEIQLEGWVARGGK